MTTALFSDEYMAGWNPPNAANESSTVSDCQVPLYEAAATMLTHIISILLE